MFAIGNLEFAAYKKQFLMLKRYCTLLIPNKSSINKKIIMRNFFLCFTVMFTVFSSNAQNSPSWLRYPAISPDGKTIAFGYKGDIYKVDASGGTAVPFNHS